MKKIKCDKYLEMYPNAMHAFSSYMLSKFQVTMKMYDETVTDNRYIIAARFFGWSLNIPDEDPERAITEMLYDYEEAFKKDSGKDPLKELVDMEWKERNEKLEETFKRPVQDYISNCLIPLTNYRFDSISDCLIPYQVRKSPYELIKELDASVKVTFEEQQLWLDNIQFAWNVSAGKIEIPF
jgi:hypothetical protein